MVLDIALPKVDGITVVRTLRAREDTEALPIISLSASVGQGAHTAILEAGANLALDKPCMPNHLEETIRRLLMSRLPAPKSK